MPGLSQDMFVREPWDLSNICPSSFGFPWDRVMKEAADHKEGALTWEAGNGDERPASPCTGCMYCAAHSPSLSVGFLICQTEALTPGLPTSPDATVLIWASARHSLKVNGPLTIITKRKPNSCSEYAEHYAKCVLCPISSSPYYRPIGWVPWWFSFYRQRNQGSESLRGVPIIIQQVSGEAETQELRLVTSKGTESLNYNPLSGIYQIYPLHWTKSSWNRIWDKYHTRALAGMVCVWALLMCQRLSIAR